MVRWAVKRSLRADSCCKVEVVNGGAGFCEKGFFSTSVTVNADCRSAFSRALALTSASRNAFDVVVSLPVF